MWSGEAEAASGCSASEEVVYKKNLEDSAHRKTIVQVQSLVLQLRRVERVGAQLAETLHNMKRTHLYMFSVAIEATVLQCLCGALHLCEVPESLRGSGDGVALLQPGGSSSAVVHQAFGVGQEGGGAQWSQLEEALGGVAGQLQRARANTHIASTELNAADLRG